MTTVEYMKLWRDRHPGYMAERNKIWRGKMTEEQRREYNLQRKLRRHSKKANASASSDHMGVDVCEI